MRYKVAIRFAITGDLRFISHHDSMRLFERALSRAQLPVKFSEGFNPRPKLSLPLPRPVGIASEADLLVVELCEPMAGAEVLEKLASQMPSGLRLTEALPVSSGRTPQAERVEYTLAIPLEIADSVAKTLSRLMEAETWVFERIGLKNKPSKPMDLRAYLVDASVDAGQLRWTVRVTPGGSIRPAELLSALGLDPETWLHRIRRSAIHWSGLQASEIVGESADLADGQAGD